MSFFDEILGELGNITVYVQRYTKTELRGGRQKSSAMQPFKVKARKQRVTGRDLEILPEGKRTFNILKLYFETPIYGDDSQKKQKADKLLIGKETYEVVNVEEHTGLDLDHFVVLAARVN